MNPLQIGAAFGLLIAVGVWCMAQSVQRAPRSLASARHRMAGNGRSGTPHSVGRSSGLRANWAEHAAAGAPGRWAAGHFGERLATIGMTPTDVVSRVLAASGVMAFILLAARELHGRDHAAAGPLILAGSIGFLFHAHEAQPMLAALTANTAAFWALTLMPRRPGS